MKKTKNIDARVRALMQHLEIKDADEVIVSKYDEQVLEAEGNEYYVLTDDEADKVAADYINDSVWAFNSSFIIEHSKALDFDDASEKVVKAIAEQCENGNEAMKKLIDNMEEFIEDAISADGRGHFISGYDGNEEVEQVGEEDYYIYRR